MATSKFESRHDALTNPLTNPLTDPLTDPYRRELSALVDGELNDYQGLALHAALGRDPGLRAVWERYHLIGQALRGQPVSPAARDLVAAVRLGTAAASPAPGAASAGTPSAGAPVPPKRARLWRAPFAGAALAAGAAFVTVFAVPGRHQSAPPVRLSQPAPSGAVRVNAPVLRRWQIDQPELSGILDRYLVNHQQSAPAARGRGLLPYVTLVGHESPR